MHTLRLLQTTKQVPYVNVLICMIVSPVSRGPSMVQIMQMWELTVCVWFCDARDCQRAPFLLTQKGCNWGIGMHCDFRAHHGVAPSMNI